MNKNNIFHIFDTWVFQQVDIFLSSTVYQNYTNWKSGLDENWTKIIHYGLNLISLTIPPLLVLILLSSNHSTKNKITQHNIVLTEIAKYNQNKKEYQKIANVNISKTKIFSKASFSRELSNIVRRKSISPEAFKVKSFMNTTISSTLKKKNIVIEYKNLTLSDFTKFLSEIIGRKNFKVSVLNVFKNTANNLLKGSLEINLYNSNINK